MTYKIKKMYRYKDDSQAYEMFLGKIISNNQNHYVFDEREALEMKTLKDARKFIKRFKDITNFKIVNETGKLMKV